LKHRKELDGLRALAVVPVVMFHAGFDWFKGGFVGVDVFFVISGYLITSLIISEKLKGSFSLGNFYERRARRILPALFMVVLLSIPFGWYWMLPEEWSGFSKSLVSVPLFVSNIQFFLEAGYFDVASEYKPLLHTWSLAVEEQFYLLFPILIILVWKIKRMYLLGVIVSVGVGSIVLSQYALLIHPDAAFYLLPTRGWELMLGAAISIIHTSPKVSIRTIPCYRWGAAIGLALIIYSVVSFDRTMPVPGVYTLIPTLGVALIILFEDGRSWTGKILASRPLVCIGLISYSWYLWHYPMLVFGRLGALNQLDSQLTIVLIFASLLLAYFSWKYIEQPFRQPGRIQRKTFIYLFTTISLLILGIGITADSFVKQTPETLTWLGSGIPKALGSMKDDSGKGCGAREPNSACLFVAKNNKPTIAVVGDSQARVLSESIYAVAVPQGYGLLDLTKGGCPFLFDLQVFISHMPKEDCGPQYQEKRMHRLSQMRNLVVVIHSALPRYIYGYGFDNGRGGVARYEPMYISKTSKSSINDREREILSAFHDTVRKIVSMGHKLIIVDPVPTTGWNPIRRLLLIEKYGLSHTFDDVVDYMKIPYANVLEREKSSRNIIESVSNQFSDIMSRVETLPIFCDSYIPEFCTSISRDKILYSDRDHVSLDGGLPIVERVVSIISGWKNYTER
tara:strand:+ start:7043 stop:9076 length:2034 start_codon:yes stop_codon:yes gene_type:complete